MRYVALSILLLLLSFAPSCGGNEPAADDRQTAPSVPDPEADIRVIESIYKRFSQAYTRLDPDRAASLYTEDALYLSPGGDIRHGRNAIRETFESFFQWAADGGFNLEIAFDSVDRGIEGDLAYDIGYYTLTRRSGEEVVAKDRGKFVVVLKRQPNDSWRFHVDAYNSAHIEAASEED